MRYAVVWALLSAIPALATSYATPQRRDVFSKNWSFVLQVNPETRVHTVFAVSDRTKPLWSFSCAVWHFPFLISNDGDVVATIAWQHVKVEDVPEAKGVTFWNKSGVFRTHALHDLCANPSKTQWGGPVGDFWRTWYTDVDDAGETFKLHTTCSMTYVFRYSDGEIVERRNTRWHTWAIFCGALLATGVAIAIWRWRSRRRTQLNPE